MFILDKNKVYPSETESLVVVRFQDCDPLRHLNNAKYFDYFFNAREDQVPKLYGLQVTDFYKKYHAAWVIYNHNISYLRPAMMGEWVTINSRIVWFNHNTLVVEYAMLDQDKSHLKTLLWSTMRYVNIESGRSTDHEGEVLDFLHATKYSGVDYEKQNILERIKTLKQQINT